VAREHLAPDPARSWSDEAGMTVINPDYATAITDTGPDTGTVRVSASQLGTVDQRGVFVVAEQRVFTRSYDLARVDGEWRITDPPDGLVILQPDFTRLYDGLEAYFLDPTGARLVPDTRYLIHGTAQPTALVDRLLSGPSPALAAGVANPLSGAQLRRSVSVAAAGATVDLTGLADAPPATLTQLCAQLVWTLAQVQVRTVTVLLDGEPVTPEGRSATQTVDDWAGYDPDVSPVSAVGHYVDRGALRTVTTGQPAPGPAGAGAYGLTAAAVAAGGRNGELTTMAGTTGAPGQGQSLLVGPYGGELSQVLSGQSLTAPTVAATRSEVWTVLDGRQVVRVPVGGPPQAVTAPTLPGLGEARVLRLSPDGVRAAVVVAEPGPDRETTTLVVGTVVRSSTGTVTLQDLRQVAPTLTQVVDVAWPTGSDLLVLAAAGASDRVVPYTLGVDGWGLAAVSTSGLPGPPTSVAGAPGRVALVAAGGTLWQLVGGTWTTLIRGAEPLAGTAPFYPF
jgi:hypothetical protein